VGLARQKLMHSWEVLKFWYPSALEFRGYPTDSRHAVGQRVEGGGGCASAVGIPADSSVAVGNREKKMVSKSVSVQGTTLTRGTQWEQQRVEGGVQTLFSSLNTILKQKKTKAQHGCSWEFWVEQGRGEMGRAIQ